MIGVKLFVGKLDAGQRDLSDLVVANRQPRTTAADQKAVNSGRVDERNNGGVANTSDFAVLQIEDRQPHQFGEEKQACIVRCCH
jgi:hypothetical protein